jgi:hypothetical protein
MGGVAYTGPRFIFRPAIDATFPSFLLAAFV